jgi:hypothetical protein
MGMAGTGNVQLQCSALLPYLTLPWPPGGSIWSGGTFTNMERRAE